MKCKIGMTAIVAVSMMYTVPLTYAADGIGDPPSGGVSFGKAKAKSKCRKGYVFSRSRKKCLKRRAKTGCKRGYTYSIFSGKCVRKRAGIMPDADLKELGWYLARDREYGQAGELFQLAVNQNDPEVLTGLGFTYRKQGGLEKGIEYYKKALSIDPDFVRAREYLGEGFVSSGRIDLAQLQLDEIARRHGKSCSEYVQLAGYIEKVREGRW